VPYGRGRTYGDPGDGGSDSWRITSGEQAPVAVDRLLRPLPEWFGIESAIESASVLARTSV
jgi:hypothetical protein